MGRTKHGVVLLLVLVLPVVLVLVVVVVVVCGSPVSEDDRDRCCGVMVGCPILYIRIVVVVCVVLFLGVGTNE